MAVNTELVQKLSRARQILADLEELNGRIRAAQNTRPLEFAASDVRRSQEAVRRKKKELGRLDLGACVVIFILVFVTVGNWVGAFLSRVGIGLLRLAGVPVSDFLTAGLYRCIVWVVSALCSLPFVFLIRSLINAWRGTGRKRREDYNRAVDRQLLREQETARQRLQQRLALLKELYSRLDGLLKDYEREVAPWLPEDYRSPGILDELLRLVRNDRAGTLREAINLYEEEEHRRRQEQYQQAQLWMQVGQAIMDQQRHKEMKEELQSLRTEIKEIDRLSRQPQVVDVYHHFD